MDPVNGLNRLMELLRRRMTETPSRVEKRAISTSRSAYTEQPSVKPSLAQLEAGIAERIKCVDPSDENYNTKATRIFIESVLKWEFGEELIQDTHFAEMVREVNNMFKSDPNIQKGFNALLTRMRR